MRISNIPVSAKTPLQNFRERLGRTTRDADGDLIAALSELDDIWSMFRIPEGGDSHPERLGVGRDGLLMSCPCSRQLLFSPDIVERLNEMGYATIAVHRKYWEFGYIAQALKERGKLVSGNRGVGFAVGQEPLPSYFGSLGCEILATDLDLEKASEAGWVATNQHADSMSQLNRLGLMSDEDFRRRVTFRNVDMNHIPADLGIFDFIWSSCSFEHLGGIHLGKEFIWNSFQHLAPGGVAVHTTEYNVDSDWATVGLGGSVLFRRADLEEIAEGIRRMGGRIAFDFRMGNHPDDLHVDLPPFPQKVHLKLQLNGYTSTSFGLIIEKPLD